MAKASEQATLEAVLAQARVRAQREQEQLKDLGGKYYAALGQIAKAEEALAAARQQKVESIVAMAEAEWPRRQISEVCGLSSKAVDEALRAARKTNNTAPGTPNVSPNPPQPAPPAPIRLSSSTVSSDSPAHRPA